VLAADVAGYTRLMERAEEETHRRLMQINQSIVLAALAQHGGKLVKHTGDGFLATFRSAVSGAHCALAIQEQTAAVNAGQPASEAILFRMGLNLADIIIEEHDVFGDGVNVAARLQQYAEPGGIVVSGIVAEAIAGEVPATIVSVGDFYPKNLSRPIQAFVMHRHGTPPASTTRSARDQGRPSIAVLPFSVSSACNDNESAYLAGGVIEGIIHVLSGLDELLVIAQGSTLAYAVQRPDVRVVGRELGVRYVLSGSVRRSGNRLRILTELSETETGTVARTDRYDGELADLFEIQDRISAHAVNSIAPDRLRPAAARQRPDAAAERERLQPRARPPAAGDRRGSRLRAGLGLCGLLAYPADRAGLVVRHWFGPLSGGALLGGCTGA
jgi:adenylate cyclase